jgi:hypothetical protein
MTTAFEQVTKRSSRFTQSRRIHTKGQFDATFFFRFRSKTSFHSLDRQTRWVGQVHRKPRSFENPAPGDSL